MKTIIYYINVFILPIIFSISCRKENNSNIPKQEKQTILKKLDRIDIEYIDSRTAKVYNNESYDNDSVFYHNSNQINLYIKGKSSKCEYTEKRNDSLINLYHLNKIKFNLKRTYEHHFEYEDCILNRKIKMDSGAVHTLKGKNGATYQIINIRNKPIWLQICYKGKTYKERILSGIDNIYGKLLGYGDENVMLYDIDKDGHDELLIIINDGGDLYTFADAYKINLPK